MQILAGQYKSRRIITSSELPYRPTQTRIRKSLFDILGAAIKNWGQGKTMD